MRNWLLLVALAASSLMIGMIVCALQASADPIVAPGPRLDTTFRLTGPVTGIAWLFFVNTLVNLFWYSGLLLALAKRYVSSSGIIETSGIRFLVALICAVMVISLIGATVDYYLVTQPRIVGSFDDTLGRTTYVTYRTILFDLANWTAALLMIVLSIVACSLIFLRLRVPLGLLIATGFVFINLAFWILIAILGEGVTFLTILLGVLSAPIVVGWLIRWYTVDRPILARSSPVFQG